jgi:hypothetical protein
VSKYTDADWAGAQKAFDTAVDNYLEKKAECDTLRAELAAANARIVELEAENVKTCLWTYEDFDSSWNADCGLSWNFEGEGPEENNCKYCPSCGKMIVIRTAPPAEVKGE